MNRRNIEARRLLRVVACISAFALSTATATAQQPLHVRIDEQIEAANRVPSGPLCSDAEFIRRASLDLIGMPPRVDDVRAFLADQAPDKREKLIDRLMASPYFDRHLTTTLDVMLMERRRPSAVKQDQWLGYLLESVRSNKHWNQLAKEILAADGTDEKMRQAARFYLDRGSEPNLLTRDVGRIFFGMDLQCAQCHNHPLFSDYHQSDYYGIYAFLEPGYAFTAPDKKVYFAEKAGNEVKFASVFESDVQYDTSPKLPGSPEIVEPMFHPGDEYTVKPGKTVRPVPKFSRRSKLAELATNGENRRFNENIANRLWALMMGRGLVNPPDLLHWENPPSHPALLKLLGEEFARMNFDMRTFLRELAFTKTYQRSMDLPAGLADQAATATETLKTLQAERERLQTLANQADDAWTTASTEWTAAKTAAEPVLKELADARKASAEVYKKFEPVEKAANDAADKLKSHQAAIAAVEATSAQAAKAVAALPNEKELASASAVFTKRLEELKKQLPALEKANTDKQAALKAPSEALEASRKAIDAIVPKHKPLEDTIRRKQAVNVAARQAYRDAAAAVERMDQRIANLEQLAALATQQKKAAEAVAAVNERQKQLAAAQKAVDDFTPTLKPMQDAVAAAKTQLDQAETKAKTLRAESERQQTIIASLTQAEQQTRSALEQLKEDTDLADAASKLKQKAESLQTKLTEFQKTVATGEQALADATKKHTAAAQTLADAQKELAARKKTLQSATQALAAARTTAETERQAIDTITTDLAKRYEEQFSISPLKPLTPEQLGWSMLRVTGVLDRYEAQGRAELDKKEPLSDEAKKDPAQLAARERKVEEYVYSKLAGSVNAFINIYGAGSGQPQGDFFATVDQALFAANGGSLIGWVAPSGDNVTDRMNKTDDPAKAAEELYLTILTRLPTADETAAVTKYLQSRPKEKSACVQELAWALLNTAEFRFNH